MCFLYERGTPVEQLSRARDRPTSGTCVGGGEADIGLFLKPSFGELQGLEAPASRLKRESGTQSVQILDVSLHPTFKKEAM